MIEIIIGQYGWTSSLYNGRVTITLYKLVEKTVSNLNTTMQPFLQLKDNSFHYFVDTVIQEIDIAIDIGR